MSNLNKAMLIGRVGKDPETRYLSSGSAVVNFSLATSEKWKDKSTGEKKEATEWHKITAFDKLAEIISEYVEKGDLLYIEGKLTTRKWQDKDGQDRYTTEIRANQMQMLGSKRPRQAPDEDAPTNPLPEKPAATKQASSDDMDDDIPF